MATAKKLTPVKRTAKSTSEVEQGAIVEAPNYQEEILAELKKQSEYMHRMDWKLWVIMGVMKNIAEDNGYSFDESQFKGD
jgi:hypothetical protein